MAAPLKTAYASYPSVKLKGMVPDKKNGGEKFAFLKELLFGDWVAPEIKNNKYVTATFTEDKKDVTYVKVRARGTSGYLREEDFQANRVLEVNFVDVGQGDGCHIVTPDDKHFLIDAGPSDNMYRFLKWRFNLKYATTPPPPFTVIVSHSDSDHYKGFGPVFTATKDAKRQFTINKIYHNGMVELSGAGIESLGKISTKNGEKFVTGLCDTAADYEDRADVTEPGIFIKTMNKSKAPKESLRFGSPPIYNKGNMVMEILGPVAAKVNGKDGLPVFDNNKGKTKNGHSVIIKLTIGNLRLLLGGDLNTHSENYLMSHFSGDDVADIKKQLKRKSLSAANRETLQGQLEEAILKTREMLEVDIAKSCHHGSADFTSEFLRVLNPLATIVSSGDNEPHTHPRPDTIGTIGKHSRGERSLIFSTELARSGKEFIELIKPTPKSHRDDDEGAYEKIEPKKRERAVTVYGMINVRTDGDKVIIAQKLERAAAGRGWDIHKLEWDDKEKIFEYNQWMKHE